jgi:prophage regulatory protein
MDLTSHQPPRLLRLPQVMTATGKGRSGIYADMIAGTFPKSIRIGRRAVAWVSSEIDSWIAECVTASRVTA